MELIAKIATLPVTSFMGQNGKPSKHGTEGVTPMTALEYMERQIVKHKLSHDREFSRGASEEVLENIRAKIAHYETAAEALRKVDTK